MGSKVLILGWGRSGHAVAQLAEFLNLQRIVCDEKKVEDAAQYPDIQFIQFNDEIKLPTVDFAVISPGISPHSAMGKKLQSLKIPILSELEFAYQNCNIPILAITGTNGKTTTTELTTFILQELGIQALNGGNIGIPLCNVVVDIITQKIKPEILVIEVSSFQLEHCIHFSPHAAALLNITSDHINRYANFDDYAKMKFKIFKNISSSQNCIIRQDLQKQYLHWIGEKNVTTFSGKDEQANWILKGSTIFYKKDNQEKAIVNLQETTLKGTHNAENVMAALALIQTIYPTWDNDLEKIQKILQQFKLDAHRVELFAQYNGIQFIDDSKATNPDATLVALNSITHQKNIKLLLGGLDKSMDFSLLNQGEQWIKKAYIYGECREKIAHTLNQKIPYEIEENFSLCCQKAFKELHKDEILLLSPACASMDQFKDYIERGNCFKQLVSTFIQEQTNSSLS